jgi:hypothetical protein
MGVKTISGFFLISILLIAGGCQVGGRQGVEDPSPYVVYFSVIDPGGKGAGPSFMEAHISVLKDWKSAATWCTAQPAPGVILSRLRCTLTKAR